jgi:hypothetical protein
VVQEIGHDASSCLSNTSRLAIYRDQSENYLVTEKDRGIMLEVQEKIIAAVPGMQSIRLPCGHSPFLSHPDETVDVIVKGAALQ